MASLLNDIRTRLKENRVIYSLRTRMLSKDYLAQKKRMRSSKLKSKQQIKREMRMYSEYWGVPADEYVRYGLFERQITDDEILDYIPTQLFYCKYLKESYRGIDTSVCGDKLIQYEILRKHNIPTPEVLFVIKCGHLMNMKNEEVKFSSLSSIVNEGEKLFIKPTDGCGGSGIVVLTRTRGGYNGLSINSLKEFPIDNGRTYIVQKGLTQNPEISRIYDGCLNTLRTIVQYRDGKAKIACCILRMGRNGAEVDNSAQGGISIKVNFEDGTFSPAAIAEHGGEVFYSHPDTGYNFQHNRIAGWESIKAGIIENTSKLSEYRDIGWDIALTDTGVSVIEFNLGYGIAHAQLSCGGLRRILNAYPDNDKQRIICKNSNCMP